MSATKTKRAARRDPAPLPNYQRTMDQILDLIAIKPNDKVALAGRLSVSTQTLWKVRNGMHARCPIAVLDRIEKLAKRFGMIDGSPAPGSAEIFTAWSRRRAGGA